jgi:hypothetical protein
MAGAFSRDGKDFYLLPDGGMATVDAGFDTTTTYPDWTPATKDDVDERDRARAQAKLAPGRDLHDETGQWSGDKIFGQTPLSPDVQASPYSDETLEPAIDEATDEVKAFNALPPYEAPEPAPYEAPKPFSRDGKDFYVDGQGHLHTVDAGFDPSEDYPDFTPATAEQVHKRDIQKRSGSFRDQLRTIPETALATVADTISGVHKAIVDPRYNPDPKSAFVQPEDIAPGVFTPEAKERREANPTSAFLGAAAPDLLTNFLVPGEGVASTAARLLASSIVTEAGNSVIEGDEFSMSDALGVYAPTQLAFEGVGVPLLKQAGRALGWTKDTLGTLVQRSRSNAVADALREADPVKRSEKLVKNAAHVYEQAQTELDEAMSVIDARMSEAPDKLFTPSALKKTVSSNIYQQHGTFQAIARQLANAAEVSGDSALEKASKELSALARANVREGRAFYRALREQWQALATHPTDNPLAREALEALDQTLGDATVWGRAAENHAAALAEMGAGSVRGTVRDVATHEALGTRLDQAKRVASLTGDKALADAVAKGRKAVELGSEVTGARILGGKASNAEIDLMRRTLEAFPAKAPKVVETVTSGLEKLEGIADDLLPDAWPAERVDGVIVGRAAGSKAARQELDAALDHADEWVKRARDAGAESPGKLARAESEIGKLRAALADVDQIPKMNRAVRDFDANPQGWLEKGIDAATGKAASRIVSGITGPIAGGAAGYAGGGFAGLLAGAAVGRGSEHFVEPLIRERSGQFGAWLKQAVRARSVTPESTFTPWLKDAAKKYGHPVAGVAALYASNRLANDPTDPSPNAAATVALVGLPLFVSKGGNGRAKSLLTAMRELDKHVTERGIPDSHWGWHDEARKLFEGDSGSLVADALRRADREGLDIHAKDAARELKKLVGEYGYFYNRLNTYKRDPPDYLKRAAELEGASKAKAAEKRLGSAKVREAREALGEVGRQLTRPDFEDRLRARVKSPAPLTLDDVRGNILRLSLDVPYGWEGEWVWDPVKATSVRQTPKTEADAVAWRAARQKEIAEAMGPLQAKVSAAMAGVDPTDRVARVTVEDDTIRQLMRDALGMRTVARKRELDIATDATSRYRKAKAGFDTWRKAALDEPEHKATVTWQTMRYRSINADARGGATAAAEAIATDPHSGLPTVWGDSGVVTDVSTPEFRADIPRIRKVGANLQSALNKAVAAGKNVPGRVTRGIAMPSDEVERLLAAKTVTAQGFMSTSIHSGTPKGFAERRAKEFGEVPVMLTIEQRTGIPLGQGEGELTLRPGTKFDVVWAKPADSDGVVTAYLRESEESKLTAADILQGIAGKIPTEAKVAGGLLAVGSALDDDDDDSGSAAAGVGGLGLLALLSPRLMSRSLARRAAADAAIVAMKGLDDRAISKLDTMVANARPELIDMLTSAVRRGDVPTPEALVDKQMEHFARVRQGLPELSPEETAYLRAEIHRENVNTIERVPYLRDAHDNLPIPGAEPTPSAGDEMFSHSDPDVRQQAAHARVAGYERAEKALQASAPEDDKVLFYGDFAHEAERVVTAFRDSIDRPMSVAAFEGARDERLAELAQAFENATGRPPSEAARDWMRARLDFIGGMQADHVTRVGAAFADQDARAVRVHAAAESRARESQELMRPLTSSEEASMGEALRAAERDLGLIERHPTDAQVDKYVAHVAENRGWSGRREEMWLRDQLGQEGGDWTDTIDAAAERVGREHRGDPGRLRLTADDIVRQIESGKVNGWDQAGRLTPWVEYNVRYRFNESRSRFEAAAEAEARKSGWQGPAPSPSPAPRWTAGAHLEADRASPGLDGLPEDSDALHAAGINVIRVHDESGIENVFGQPLSLDDMRDLFGLDHLRKYAADVGQAIDSALTVTDKSVRFRGEVKNPAHDGVIMHIERIYTARPDGKGFTTHNSYFILPDSLQAEGVGKTIMNDMADAHERLGGTEMNLSAAWVGKYIWAKLGFRPSKEAEQLAFASFGDALRGWLGGAENLFARTMAPLETLRDLADVKLPLDRMRSLGTLRASYEDVARRSRVHMRQVPFDEAFIRRGKDGGEDTFLAGKAFLMTHTGPWNQDLRLRIAPGTPWYDEYRRRIGAGAAFLGFGLHELIDALNGSPSTTWTQKSPTQEDEEHAERIVDDAHTQASAINEQREQDLDDTREKLSYLSHQGRELMTSAARQLASANDNAGRTVERVPGVTASQGVARFLGSASTLSEAYADKRSMLLVLQRDPASLVDELSESLGELQDRAPDLHAQVTGQAFKVAQYLQSKLPATVGASLLRPNGSPPSQLAIRQFALYYSAATDPSSVIGDLANNRARKEQIDTLREVWPDTYSRLKAAVVEQLASGRPTLAQRSRLDLLFDFGPGLDRAFSPGLVAVLNDYRAQREAGGAGGPQKGGQMPSRRTQPSVGGTGALGSLALGPGGGPGVVG